MEGGVTKKIIGLILLLSLLLTGCASHRFVPTGMDQTVRTPKPENCNAQILLRFPNNTVYSEIGLCMAQVPGGGMISDKTPEAIAQLQRCSCLAGGDAIVLQGTNDAGIIPAFGGYSQQVAKSQGVVIIFK